ncbi:hypothetical protein AAFC00_006015 [Neodothiora populina]|uniref:ABC transporter domain-containing protein n=1 Tax=Neodothiora populina TaxID=2781224 RepID=A0ABR3P6N9_9PEZI
MKIEAGQKIGICGRSGSGKSSLLLALVGLIETCAGSITIDGIDIGTVPRETVRQRLIAIPQHPFILPGTVRANADPYGLAPDVSIVSALTKVGVWSALATRGGLDAMLSEQPLSQGEQQLFCLARAMLRKSKVLVLDEATSSVDNETDNLVQRIIKEHFQGYTIVSVAHRLDTIIDSAKIAVFDAGQLVEFDSPEKLLSRDNSLFRAMYRS